MATRFTSVSSCKVTVNGSEQTSESSFSAVLGSPMTSDQLRQLREAMARAGVDFDYWETPTGEGCSFGFSTTSRRRSR